MCGVAGWIGVGTGAGAADVVARMTETLAARGPDGTGVWAGPGAVLGHRRLAVIDLEGGRQPMILADGDDEPVLVITYSGEVYNHVELRAELELLGHKFRTDSDTEVVLHAVREWGTDAVGRLNGMYAFAVWDTKRQSLLLARDRLGVKPLCYARCRDGVLFASEPKALFASGRVTPAVDEDGLRDFLASVRIPGGSLYRGVREVRPGTTVVVDRDGVREHRYWRLRAHPHTDDLATTAYRVRELLEDVAEKHLRADVPLGALLSGGLDSSVLAALGQHAAGRARADALRTFSVDFAGHTERFVPDGLRATPDAPYVRDMVAHCRLDHRDVSLAAAALCDPAVRQAVVHARDAPATGDMDVSLHLLFRAVREQSTVVISGESADEVFGGYPWFHDPGRTGGDFPWRYLTGRSGTYHALLRTEVAGTLDVAAHRADRYRAALAEVPVLPGEPAAQRRQREVFYLHLVHWLPDLLDRKDRLSMAAGLEVRVPFCDHRLVEYAFNVPWSMHTAGGVEKGLLRTATRDLLPASVATRTKAPYPATLDPAYDRAVRDQARELLADRTAPAWTYLDPARLRERLTRPVTDRATRAGIDFALNLDLWLRSM